MIQLRSCNTVFDTNVRIGVDLRSIGPIYGKEYEMTSDSASTRDLRPGDDKRPVEDHAGEVSRVSED